MKTDHFWETFWLGFLAIALISLFGSSALFFFHIQSLNAAAVGVAFDSTKDPFEAQVYRTSVSIQDGYVYRNALPLGLKQWRWDSVLDWTAKAQVYEGSAALGITFTNAWGGMGMNGFSISTASNHTISLAVYPDASVGDLYLELYDSRGNSMGRQSLGWYAPSGSLMPNQWQYISVPLDNLTGSSSSKVITGLSISTKNPGKAYLDAIQFQSTATSHSVWILPQGGGAPFNPFATSTPLALPYKASFNAQDFSHWYSYYGTFDLADNGFTIGPRPDLNTDSVSVYRSGRFWSDYQAKVTLDWGISSTFSLLVRFTDPGNFVSCAYSYYGQSVQIYQVKNGVSTQLAQSPSLGIRYDTAWQDVKVGASAQGSRVSCYVGDDKILSADIPDLSNNGTVGMEVWDKNSYSSGHTIKSFEVTPMLGE